MAALEGVKGREPSCCWIHTFIISIQQARGLKAGRSGHWSKAEVTRVSQRRGCLVFLLQCPCLCPASDRVPKGPSPIPGFCGRRLLWPCCHMPAFGAIFHFSQWTREAKKTKAETVVTLGPLLRCGARDPFLQGPLTWHPLSLW